MIYIDLETIPPPRTSPGLDAALTHRRDKRLTDPVKIAIMGAELMLSPTNA